MKRKLTFIILLIFILNLGLTPAKAAPKKYISNTHRGVWVASVANIDFPSKTGLSVNEMKAELRNIVNNASKARLNAIYFQVRPSADSLYAPNQFPWSKWLTGTQGLAPEDGFDPLKYIISKAEAKNIQVHAWMNPYRITTGNTSKPEHDLNALAQNHPARLNPSWVVKHSDGKMYFNPGIPEVIDLVVEESKYLIKNYNLAGIHFDDYFYPDRNFNDNAAFKKYGGKYTNKDNWRRNNVTKLVNRVRKGIKKIKPYTVFGVSPFAVWANKSSNKLGSDTRAGIESYYDQFADTRMWVKKNKIDYIIPQIYWHIGFEIADYKVILKWWTKVAKKSKVKLYIGHAAYRLGEDPNWNSIKTLTRQLNMNKRHSLVKGSVFYGYRKLNENKYGIIGKLKSWCNGSGPYTKFKINKSSKVIKTRKAKYKVKGRADYRYVVKQGRRIIYPNKKGVFSRTVNLKPGMNEFVFKHRGKQIRVRIRRKVA